MRALRHALVASAALALIAPAARSADVTPPNLSSQTSVQDTDLLLIWRASGPLKNLNASVLESYVQGKLSGVFLAPGNNLSDLGSASIARTNLGLGTASQASTGTSGSALCFLNTACNWSGAQTFVDPITLNGAAATNRRLLFQSSGSNRWALYADSSAESGSNAGSLLEIGRYSDAGTYIDSPLTINRATGVVTFADGISGNLTGNVTGNLTGAVTGTTLSASGAASLNGGASVTGGLTVSTGGVTVSAGTTSLPASSTTVPALKIAAGSLLTTPQAGAVEADGASLYYTLTSGPTRKTLAFADASNIQPATQSVAGVAPAKTYATFQFQQTSGTSSGETLTLNTWIQRSLSNTVFNSITGASLSLNQFVLPAGTYEVEVIAPETTTSAAFVTKARLRNVTDSTTTLLGTNASGGISGQSDTKLSIIRGQFTIGASKTFEVDSFSAGSAGNGGLPAGTGEAEVYTVVNVTKIG